MDSFLDLETLTVNRQTKTPSHLKTVPFSVAYAVNKSLKVHIKTNIKSALYHLSELALSKNETEIKIYAHNSSKYDSHFILAELISIGFKKYLNLKPNMFTPDNCLVIKQKDIQNNEVVELRYKSSNKLSLAFKLNNVFFEVIDTFPKTVLSLEAIGKRLNKLGLLDEQYLKTDFDYTKYDLQEDLEDEALYTYANNILKTINSDQLTYIKNDVIILQSLVNNFSTFFDGFSIKEFALNGNVINSYTNDKSDKLATHHILNRIYDKRAQNKYFTIQYGDYKLDSGVNLFKFFKSAYRGGVCYYNDNYIDIEIKEYIKAYDINSSYPKVLYSNKVPHTIIDYSNEKEFSFEQLSYKLSNTYSIFSVSLSDFKSLTSKLRSTFKKINNSYYKTYSKLVHINSMFIDELLFIHGIDKTTILKTVDKVTFDLKTWGGKKYLKEFYQIKQNSKRLNQKRLVMNDKGQMIETDELIDVDESYMTDVAKVRLNSIYGASGIADYVDYFYHDTDDNLVRAENGIKNNERNIVMSLFVTSSAKYNLLYPLKDLTELELDDSFLYCDTDSLYLKAKDSDKVTKNMIINPDDIGAWGCDSSTINRFKILNHKIYSYYDPKKKKDKKNPNNKITCKMCGVSKKTITKILNEVSNDWDKFSKEYFFVGSEMPAIKSILNIYGTISIYDSVTVLKSGAKYNDEVTFAERIKFFNTIDELYNTFDTDLNINDETDLDSESDAAIVYFINGGAYSRQDIIQIYNEHNNINLDPYIDYIPIKELIDKDYPEFLSKMKHEIIDYALVVNLINSTEYNHNKQSKSRFKYSVKYKTNHSYTYLKALYELKLFNLVSLRNREHDILRAMIRIDEDSKDDETL